MMGKRLAILVSQAMCAMRHVCAELNKSPGLELGGNFAQGCSGHALLRNLEIF